jgi:mono/diheme cytochrome c family protein
VERIDNMILFGGKFRRAVYLALALGLMFMPRGASGSKAQGGRAPQQQTQQQIQQQPQQQTRQQPQQLIRSVEGPDLFRAYCASCHGSDGKGHGPAAAGLKTRVADLTVLAKNNGGVFPATRVRTAIMGEEVIASHGSREMPIWGPIFHQIEADVDRGNVRLENLVTYLQSIQSIPSPKARAGKAPVAPQAQPTGAQLFKQLCAACHGNDLKGNGPAPYPFRDTPPDLTTLAQRHDGKFPDAYVANVLRNGITLPAHGPSEMPIWGIDFKASGHLSDEQVTSRISELTDYIKSQQAK